MNIRAALSEIKLDQRVLSDDLIMTDRYLWNKIKNKTLLFIDQRNDKLNYNFNNNIYTPICMEMEITNSTECCIDIPICPLLKSKKRIPKIAESNKSALIKGIYTLDKRNKLSMVTLNDWIRLKKSKYKSKKSYVFMFDEYLYADLDVPQAFVIEAFFENIEELPNFTCGCEEDNNCYDVLDTEWKISSDLQAYVLQEVNKDLASFYQRIPEIENTNKNVNFK